MFINKLNQLYRPRRKLYYLEAGADEIREFCSGKLPESLGRYRSAFGSYDFPGVFFFGKDGKAVIGIEYRMDDERVDYPKDLASAVLEDSFFYSIEIDNEIEIDREMVQSVFESIARDDDAHRAFSDLSIKQTPGVVCAFPDGKKIRILYEWKLDEDRARYIMRDDPSVFDKPYLYRTAFFDPITKHYNWNHLEAYLEMPMDAGIADYAFVHFDIKEFRVINEVYGHVAANKVLCNVVRAMNEADFVCASARCHNDNFAMMIKDMPEAETAERLRKLFDGLSRLEEDPNYRIYFRCGVVLMPHSLLMGNRVADAAKLAQSLGSGRSRTEITVYTDRMHNDISWGNYIKAYLETAVENDEFTVYLQPKINIADGTLEGAEALVRWNYKRKEFLHPARFVPFFEKDGSIGRIDDIVLRKVCLALNRWKKEGRRLRPVSVNLSRNRLYDTELIRHLTEITDSLGVSRELIDLELTESATYDNTEHMINVLHGLRREGFKISMDDFGTGYSSLSLLTVMPLDTLKIDKSFVDRIGIENEKEEDIIVLRHIISLAAELGFVCLAEGAESKEQVERLRMLGCGIVQGYYYSRPLPIEEFEEKYL